MSALPTAPNTAGVPGTSPAQTEPRYAGVREYDKTTKAVLAYFEATDNTAIRFAFDDLIKILLKATGDLFLVELGVRSLEETEAFLRAWLLQKLSVYPNTDAIRQAARMGKFCYLGNQGRNALIDELRKRSSSEDVLLQRSKIVQFDPETEDDGPVGPDNLVAMDRRQGVASAIGRKPGLEPLALHQKLQALPDGVAESLGESSFALLCTVCELFPDRLAGGEVTRAIAKSRGVSEQTARKLHRTLTSTLRMMKCQPLIQGLIEIISCVGDPTLLGTTSGEPQRQSG